MASAQASVVPACRSSGPKAGPSRAQARKYPGPLPDRPRSSVFHRCQWVSTRPGATIIPRASSTAAPGASSAGPTAAMRSAVHEDVAGRDVAEFRVHGEQVAAADDEALGLACHRVTIIRGPAPARLRTRRCYSGWPRA